MNILQLKNKFAQDYRVYRSSTAHLDCGLTLAHIIKPDLALLAKSINDQANVLRQNDPAFPASWIPLPV